MCLNLTILVKRFLLECRIRKLGLRLRLVSRSLVMQFLHESLFEKPELKSRRVSRSNFEKRAAIVMFDLWLVLLSM